MTNTLHHHYDLDVDTLQFVISSKIVETIINDLFFRDDDQPNDIDNDEGEQNADDTVRNKFIKKQNEKRAMKLFSMEEDEIIYTMTIKNIL